MEKLSRAALLCTAAILFAAASMAQKPGEPMDANASKHSPVYLKKDSPAKDSAKADAPPRPIAVDAEFTETLADYQMIEREIARIETATGPTVIPVSIEQLRERADGKLGKLKGWLALHKVPNDWGFDAKTGTFSPPPKAEKAMGEGQAKKEGQ